MSVVSQSKLQSHVFVYAMALELDVEVSGGATRIFVFHCAYFMPIPSQVEADADAGWEN